MSCRQSRWSSPDHAEPVHQVLLRLLNEGTALAKMSKAEFEALLEDFSKGSELFPPLPPDLSRVDVYTRYPDVTLVAPQCVLQT
jgi:hypothetical protein